MNQMNQTKVCYCRKCCESRGEGKTVSLTGKDITNIGFNRMILCDLCGNKRCPHATDHKNPCTNSNETGQPGSVY